MLSMSSGANASRRAATNAITTAARTSPPSRNAISRTTAKQATLPARVFLPANGKRGLTIALPTRLATLSPKAREKMAIAEHSSIANYSFYHGSSNDNLENIKIIDPLSCCGLKVFMGSTNGSVLIDDRDTLSEVFKSAPLLVATHCEDTPTIIENQENYRQIYGDDVPIALHPKIRSEEACFISTSLAIELAKMHDTRLHVLHISTAKEAELFSDLPVKEKRITNEVCEHYLTFSDEDYETKGSLIKCNPSIKTAIDRAALFQGLLEGTLDRHHWHRSFPPFIVRKSR